MAWRGLHISRPARLTLADGQLCVSQDDGEARFPLEDVAWVIIDTPQATMTAALLSACAQSGSAVIFVDQTHTPSGVLLPFHRHFRQGEIARLQLGAGEPIRKRLWRRLVQAKIANQAAALDRVGAEGGKTLREIARHVRSGDPDNVEARAARAYWGYLWRDFRRDDDKDRRNALLNYGYAVVRSAVARGLTAAGFLPAVGLHHDSVGNAFNLADDMVEPFRPFIDVSAWRVAGCGAKGDRPLTREDRQAMAGCLSASADMAGEIVTLLLAAERAAAGLTRALQKKETTALILPEFAPEDADEK
jgi:CRISP-associated protein Cas1